MADTSHVPGDSQMPPTERAARALCEADGNPADLMMGAQPMWKSYLPKVRIVLEAIHEPNDRMSEAGGQVMRYLGREESLEAYKQDADNVWRLMVDAAKIDLIH